LRGRECNQKKNHRQQETCKKLFCMPDDFHFFKNTNKNTNRF
jgi:hypothetical protein